MTVYLQDVIERMQDTMAVITGTTGSILKMDSTKKVRHQSVQLHSRPVTTNFTVHVYL